MVEILDAGDEVEEGRGLRLSSDLSARSRYEYRDVRELRKPECIFEQEEAPLIGSFTALPIEAADKLEACVDIELQLRHPQILVDAVIEAKRASSNAVDALLNKGEFINERRLRAAYLEFGERVANGVIAEAFHPAHIQEHIGPAIRHTRELPKHHDHGYTHVRIVENGTHLDLLSLPTLEYKQSGWRNYVACSLTYPFHDFGQIPAIIWNEQHPEKRIKVKAGHAEEGACMVDILAPVIARQGNMTMELALETAGVAAVMMMPHDHPETFEERLRGTKKAFKQVKKGPIPIEDRLLFTYYDDGTLDLFTTSRSQRLKILRHVKEKTGVMAVGEREHGFHPGIEEKYGTEIAEAEKDTKPLFAHISAVERNSIIQFALTFGLNDVKAMMSPKYTYLRKFNVDYSRKRPVYMPDGRAVERILGPDGDLTASDDERGKFECLEFARYGRRSPLWNNDRIRRLIVNTALKGFVDIDEITRGIMKGEERLDSGDQGFAVFEHMTHERIYEAGLKAMKKAGIDDMTIQLVEVRMQRARTEDELQTCVYEQLKRSYKRVEAAASRHKIRTYTRRFLHRTQAIRHEEEVATLRMREKPTSVRVNPQDATGIPKVFTAAEYAQLDTDNAAVFRELCQILLIQETEGIDIVKRMKEGRPIPILTNGAYDSLGGPKDMKTWIRLNAEILDHLEREETEMDDRLDE